MVLLVKVINLGLYVLNVLFKFRLILLLGWDGSFQLLYLDL